jgi:histidine ammonia-lyase
MDNTHYISTAVLSFRVKIISQQMSVELSDEAKINIQKCRFFDNKNELTLNYLWINTGFGSLCNVKISNLSKLQENLVKSHACGRESAKGNRQTDALA